MQKLQAKTRFEGRFWISPLHRLKKSVAKKKKIFKIKLHVQRTVSQNGILCGIKNVISLVISFHFESNNI